MEQAKYSEENWHKNEPIYPIDETEDLGDPYSDLSLFLAQKIKGEMTKFGNAGKWSTKIQSQLLEKILPEFRKTFPRQRLGVSALKKMWEKVAFYYGKVNGQKEALRGDGKLNVAYMIRENLKACQARYLPTSLPPYHAANQIAAKISECIATLDGEKQSVEELTKLIWAAQKHLLKDLSAQRAKNAFEEYTTADKVIVKTQLEVLADNPLLSREELQNAVTKQLKHLAKYTKERSNEKLYSLVAKALAKEKVRETSLSKLPKETQKFISEFCEKQIDLCCLEEDREEIVMIEAIQRVLALFPLAQALPKNLDEPFIREAIESTYALLCGETEEMTIPLDHATYAFINAEIHFLSRKEAFTHYEDMEDCIVETLQMCTELPEWQDTFVDELEIAVWASCKKGKIDRLITSEIVSTLLDTNYLSFQSIIYRVIGALQKSGEVIRSCTNLEEKVAVWSHQNDMVCRWLHFDEKTPLYQLILGKWSSIQGNQKTMEHTAFVDSVYNTFTQRFALSPKFEGHIKNRIWTLYKFLWYNHAIKSDETSFNRFTKWHQVRLQKEGPSDKKTVAKTLSVFSRNVLPLIPSAE